jgi:hypothetical protein
MIQKRIEFPLTQHPTGQWCEKIRGRTFYFRKHVDAALERYPDERD